MAVSRTRRSALTDRRGDFLTSTKAILSETHAVNVQAENMQNTWLASEKWQFLTIQFKLSSPHIWYPKRTPAMQVCRSGSVTTVTDRPVGGHVSWNSTPRLVSLCTAGRAGPQLSAYCDWSKEGTMLPCSLLRTQRLQCVFLRTSTVLLSRRPWAISKIIVF